MRDPRQPSFACQTATALCLRTAVPSEPRLPQDRSCLRPVRGEALEPRTNLGRESALSLGKPWFARSPVLATIAIAALLTLAACGGAASGEPTLPDGLDAFGAIDVDSNALTYVLPGTGVTLSASAFGGTPEEALAVESMELLLRDPGVEYAMRVRFADADTAERAAALARADAEDSSDWVDVDGAALSVGRSERAWGAEVREAWASGERRPISEVHSDFWDRLRLMPENPPARPVAAGFVRNVSDLLDRLLEAGHTDAPGLSDALGFARVGSVAFVGYSDTLTSIPGASSGAILRELDAGVIFVAQGGYPGFVIDLLFRQFASGAGLGPVDVEGQRVSYRVINADLHLMVKNFGPTFFFAAGPTRARTQELMASVIRSQAGR